jgi:hemerythrin
MTPEDIRSAVACMFRYADTHFRDEEALLERVGCPLLDKQRLEHRLFMSKAAELSARTPLTSPSKSTSPLF